MLNGRKTIRYCIEYYSFFLKTEKGIIMKCENSNPDLETLCLRINRGDIDLQPDFQRGEVWTREKKERLIDSILRGWNIPPIHLVENSRSSVDEVLDGQQRLSAIRDFFNDKLRVDGMIQPYDQTIAALDGKSFSELPDDIRRKVQKYSLTVINLTDYSPEEPAELFYRLNHPTTLTSAEQRNAFFGAPRDQIKKLVRLFESLGCSAETIGFSNSRLAYDEIISKLVFIAETKQFNRKITSGMLADRYRETRPFENRVISNASDAITTFAQAITSIHESAADSSNRVRFNKATLLSWLLFSLKNLGLNPASFGKYIMQFELLRKQANIDAHGSYNLTTTLISLFNKRASMASTDGGAVVLRDFVLQYFGEQFGIVSGSIFQEVNSVFSYTNLSDDNLERLIGSYRWGATLDA